MTLPDKSLGVHGVREILAVLLLLNAAEARLAIAQEVLENISPRWRNGPEDPACDALRRIKEIK